MSCKVEKAPNGKINKVLNQSGQKSSLFQQILNVPTLSLNETIDTYKNIYSGKLKDKVKFQEPFLPQENLETITQELVDRLKQTGLSEDVFLLSTQEIEDKLKELGVSEDIRKQVKNRKRYYHSNSKGLFGKFKLRNNRGFYGVYFSPSKSYSKKFGDQVYKVDLYPKKTLEIRDKKDFQKYGNIFNISKEGYDNLIDEGYDSIAWYRDGKLMEFIVIDIDIIGEREIQFQKALNKIGINLITNGFVINDQVFLNKDTVTDETAIHEFNHLFTAWQKTNRPELYNKGISLIEAELNKEDSEIKDIIDYVRATQPNLKGESLNEEILTELVGRKGAELVTSKKKSGIIEWLKELFKEIGDMLGILGATPQEIANMTLEDFAEKSAVTLLKGENFVGE